MTILRAMSTMLLRKMLHDKKLSRDTRCFVYAELLQRKQVSRRRRHGHA